MYIPRGTRWQYLIASWAPWQRYCLTAGLTGTLVFLWWWCAYHPLRTSLRSALEAQKSHVACVEKCAILKRDIAALQKHVDLLRQQVHVDQDVVAATLSIAAQSGLADILCRGAQGITFSARGSFEEVHSFLKKLLAQITSIRIDYCELLRLHDSLVACSIIFVLTGTVMENAHACHSNLPLNSAASAYPAFK